MKRLMATVVTLALAGVVFAGDWDPQGGDYKALKALNMGAHGVYNLTSVTATSATVTGDTLSTGRITTNSSITGGSVTVNGDSLLLGRVMSNNSITGASVTLTNALGIRFSNGQILVATNVWDASTAIDGTEYARYVTTAAFSNLTASSVTVTGDSLLLGRVMSNNTLTATSGTFTGAVMNYAGGWTASSLTVTGDALHTGRIMSNSSITGSSATFSGAAQFGGYVKLYARTAAELLGITPDAVGEVYFCSDKNELFVSTGTGVGAFVSCADKASP